MSPHGSKLTPWRNHRSFIILIGTHCSILNSFSLKSCLVLFLKRVIVLLLLKWGSFSDLIILHRGWDEDLISVHKKILFSQSKSHLWERHIIVGDLREQFCPVCEQDWLSGEREMILLKDSTTIWKKFVEWWARKYNETIHSQPSPPKNQVL